MPTSAASAALSTYADYVNPRWTRLLDVLEMNIQYTYCSGAELFTADGRRILDFLSGYCVHNTGHNHPQIVDALRQELGRCGPAMLQSHVSELAGELAKRLCRSAGGRAQKVFFCSSGSEGVEAAIKFARAHTGRPGLLSAEGSFHGLTCGALSLMRDGFWSEGFGPLLPGTETIPFGHLESLERKLATKKFAALFLEPIQGEAGIQLAEAGYLRAVQDLCRRYGTLLVADEVQTGLYRTGKFLACHHFEMEPDLVILAKALSGGLVPVGAVLMPDAIYESVYRSIQRAIVHTSTFSENGLAMRAGLATLDVLENENLGRRSATLGETFRERLTAALRPYEMVRAVRGLGLLSGIEFAPPRSLSLRIPFEAFRRIPGMFGQVMVMRLFRDHGILTQMCGNNFMVLKAAPPLVASEEQLDRFVEAIRSVAEHAHRAQGFWSEAVGLARGVVNI
jgi:ornithine--oxo-acid transaminase